MASYKDDTILVYSDSAEFDKIYNPGVPAPHSGIYRCQSCKHEVASNKGQPLPPQHEIPHAGDIKWKLVVFAAHKKK